MLLSKSLRAYRLTLCIHTGIHAPILQVLQLYAAVVLASDQSVDPTVDAADPRSLLDRLLASRPEVRVRGYCCYCSILVNTCVRVRKPMSL